MSTESIIRDYKNGLTMAELVQRHINEFAEAKRKRLTKDRLNHLLMYHQREVRQWLCCQQVDEMMAAADSR